MAYLVRLCEYVVRMRQAVVPGHQGVPGLAHCTGERERERERGKKN